MVDAYLRRSVSVLLSWLLVVPVGTLLVAAPSPVGALQSVGAVYLGQDAVSVPSVVYSGDVLRTDDGKATVTLPHGNLLVLGSNSAAALDGDSQAVKVSLEKGGLVFNFSSSSQLPLRIEAAGLAMSASGSFRTLAEIALLDDGMLKLAVRRGKVSVSNLRAEPVVLAAGQVLTVDPRLAQSDQKSKPIGTGAHGKMTLGEKLRTFRIGGLSHAASVAVVVGVVGGATAAAIAIPLTVGTEKAASPSSP